MRIKWLVVSAATFIIGMTFMSMAHAADPIRFCTGGPQGVYTKVGAELKKWLPNIEVVHTKGSWENLSRLVDESAAGCDIAIAQADAYALYGRSRDTSQINRVIALYKEYAHFYCNRASGIDDVDELEGKAGKYTVAVGPTEGGAWITWMNFIQEDKDYESVGIVPYEGLDAAMKVADEASGVTCAMFMAGLGSPLMKDILSTYGDVLKLVDATDSDFNDAVDGRGNKLYGFEDVPKKLYAASQRSVETVAQQAVLFINPTKFTNRQNDIQELNLAVTRSRANILNLVGQK